MFTIEALKWQIFEQSCESLDIRCPSKVLSRVFLKQTFFFFLCWVDLSSELKHSLLEGGRRIARPRVFIRVSVCYDRPPWPKATWGERGLFQFITLRSCLITEGSQGSNSRQEAGGHNGSKGAGDAPLPDLPSLLSCSARDQQLQRSTAHSVLGFPTTVTSENNILPRLAHS